MNERTVLLCVFLFLTGFYSYCADGPAPNDGPAENGPARNSAPVVSGNSTLNGAARESRGNPGVLFIKTSPINAVCYIDGVEQEEKTPFILRDVRPGTRAITVKKKGYKTASFVYELGPGAVGTVDLELVSQAFIPLFPENEVIVFNRTDVYKQGTVLKLPDGTYSINQEEEVIRLDPVYPKQGLLNALHISLPALCLVSGLLTVNDLTTETPSALFFSPATISSYILTLGALSFDIALSRQKKRFVESYPVKPVPRKKTEYVAREHYLEGEELLLREQLTEALRYYMKIVENHRESIYYPRSLYKIGRIHNILGNYILARTEFLLLKQKYPLPELFDKTCKNLADLSFRQGEYRESIGHLDEMLFIDPFYSRENIDLYKSEILEQWFQENPDILDEVVSSYRTLLDNYGSSENANIYRVRLAYYLFLSGSREEAENIYNKIEEPNEDTDFEIELRLELLREKGLIE